MADSDWTILTDSLSNADVRRGVTDGVSPPTGGGSFVFGTRSVQSVTGAVGAKCVISGTDPFVTGGRISGAIRKGSGSGSLSYNPMLFVGLQGSAVGDVGYLLGFASNENPAHLILMKGAPASGILTTSDYILSQSTNAYSAGLWYHFQIDIIVQPSGDVLIQVKENTGNVTTPSWGAIEGMSDFTDDALGFNSGSAPYVDGRVGFAGYFGGASSRTSFFDHFVIGKQL